MVAAAKEDTDTEERLRQKLGTKGGAQRKVRQRPTVTWAHGRGNMTFKGQRQQMDSQGNTLTHFCAPLHLTCCDTYVWGRVWARKLAKPV